MENLFQNESRLINDLFQSQSPKSIIDVGKQILTIPIFDKKGNPI